MLLSLLMAATLSEHASNDNVMKEAMVGDWQASNNVAIVANRKTQWSGGSSEAIQQWKCKRSQWKSTTPLSV